VQWAGKACRISDHRSSVKTSGVECGRSFRLARSVVCESTCIETLAHPEAQAALRSFKVESGSRDTAEPVRWQERLDRSISRLLMEDGIAATVFVHSTG
jgi:hypothetical protein